MINIQISGIEALQRKLGRLRANDILVPPMEEAVKQLQNDMADYPMPKPGSRYVRTSKLAQAWTSQVDRTGSGVTGRVGNSIEYAPWVQSYRFQAAIHRGRWQTDAQVLERRRQWIIDRFKRAIDRAIERG